MDCGYPTPFVCYRLHYDISTGFLRYIEIYPAYGRMSEKKEIPATPGTTVNGIPLEAITRDIDLGPTLIIQ